jgi:hypothetical protein
MRVLLLSMLLLLASPAGAVSVGLEVDPLESSIGPRGDAAAPLSGRLAVDVGSDLPNDRTVTFDLTGVDVESDSLQITLDPSATNPGAGVLNVAGEFLIPSLHLEVGSGGTIGSLTLTDVRGTFGPGAGCVTDYCLDVGFAIDTGTPNGLVDVVIHASQVVPEPTSFALVGCAIALALCAERGRSAPTAEVL